ncbi:hypothetical protein NYV35_25520 [Escherichia coli]|nr:hypothetical protein [Escherichia coli]
MKDEIQKLACDIIDKTGLEISESNRLNIIEKAVKQQWIISPLVWSRSRYRGYLI